MILFIILLAFTFFINVIFGSNILWLIRDQTFRDLILEDIDINIFFFIFNVAFVFQHLHFSVFSFFDALIHDFNHLISLLTLPMRMKRLYLFKWVTSWGADTALVSIVVGAKLLKVNHINSVELKVCSYCSKACISVSCHIGWTLFLGMLTNLILVLVIIIITMGSFSKWSFKFNLFGNVISLNRKGILFFILW